VLAETVEQHSASTSAATWPRLCSNRWDGGLQVAAGRGDAGHGAVSTVADLAVFAADLLEPRTVSAQMHEAATSVQFPGLTGVLPGFGVQRPNDWGLGFEIRDDKSPHWTGRATRGGRSAISARQARSSGSIPTANWPWWC